MTVIHLKLNLLRSRCRFCPSVYLLYLPPVRPSVSFNQMNSWICRSLLQLLLLLLLLFKGVLPLQNTRDSCWCHKLIHSNIFILFPLWRKYNDVDQPVACGTKLGQNWQRRSYCFFFFSENFLATTVFYQKDSISGELLSVFNHSSNTDTQKYFSNAPLELGGFPVLTQHQSC